jgi:hypothetical protein
MQTQVMPEDMRQRVLPTIVLEGPDETTPPGCKFGDVVEDAKERYMHGDCVTVSFWTGSPTNDYRRTDRFMAVERFDPKTGKWEVVCADGDWETTCRWRQLPSIGDRAIGAEGRLPGLRIAPIVRIPRPEPHQAILTWQTDAKTQPGTYRITHYGRFKTLGKVTRFTATTRRFEVQ